MLKAKFGRGSLNWTWQYWLPFYSTILLQSYRNHCLRKLQVQQPYWIAYQVYTVTSEQERYLISNGNESNQGNVKTLTTQFRCRHSWQHRVVNKWTEYSQDYLGVAKRDLAMSEGIVFQKIPVKVRFLWLSRFVGWLWSLHFWPLHALTFCPFCQKQTSGMKIFLYKYLNKISNAPSYVESLSGNCPY